MFTKNHGLLSTNMPNPAGVFWFFLSQKRYKSSNKISGTSCEDVWAPHAARARSPDGLRRGHRPCSAFLRSYKQPKNNHNTQSLLSLSLAHGPTLFFPLSSSSSPHFSPFGNFQGISIPQLLLSLLLCSSSTLKDD